MYNTVEELDQHCINNAVMFTVIRGRSPFNRIREEFATLNDAKAFAEQFADRRSLIYAITAAGRCAPVMTI